VEKPNEGSRREDKAAAGATWSPFEAARATLFVAKRNNCAGGRLAKQRRSGGAGGGGGGSNGQAVDAESNAGVCGGGDSTRRNRNRESCVPAVPGRNYHD